MRNIEVRIAQLEGQRQRLTPGRYVFDSIEAAQLAGASGGVLIIGDVMDYDEWAAAAKVQPDKLCREISYGNA